jgi:uncharacterized protein YuzE
METEIEYCAEKDVLCVAFLGDEADAIVRTESIYRGVLVDYDSRDRIVQIEISPASRRIACLENVRTEIDDVFDRWVINFADDHPVRLVPTSDNSIMLGMSSSDRYWKSLVVQNYRSRISATQDFYLNV